jgi:hypothetical protein
MAPISFVQAMKHYVALLPDPTILGIGAELKALSYEEKLDFADGLRALGIDPADPEPPNSTA